MNNNDLRVKKTQRALMDSFLGLLKTKNFSQITVQDLCDRAMVRRSTFYRHYSDKYDLLNQVLANFFNSLHESHLDNLLVKEPKTYFENIVRETLYFLIENRDTIQSALLLPIMTKLPALYITSFIRVLKDRLISTSVMAFDLILI